MDAAGQAITAVTIEGEYATNKTPWPIWLFNLYHFGEQARIMEFGCGNGLIWKVNSFRIKETWQIELTDFSQGMLDAAKSYIGPGMDNISFRVIDLANYDGGNTKYTNVLANHMLYHVNKREKAIQTIAEILEPKGEFYASTVGMNNMLEMKHLVKEFTGNDNYTKAIGHITDSFSLENGAEQLSAAFKDVELIEYPDSLEISDSNDLVNYVLSCNDLTPGVQVLPEEQKNEFKNFVDKKIEKTGRIHISKSSGTFIARKH